MVFLQGKFFLRKFWKANIIWCCLLEKRILLWVFYYKEKRNVKRTGTQRPESKSSTSLFVKWYKVLCHLKPCHLKVSSQLILHFLTSNFCLFKVYNNLFCTSQFRTFFPRRKGKTLSVNMISFCPQLCTWTEKTVDNEELYKSGIFVLLGFCSLKNLSTLEIFRDNIMMLRHCGNSRYSRTHYFLRTQYYWLIEIHC